MRSSDHIVRSMCLLKSFILCCPLLHQSHLLVLLCKKRIKYYYYPKLRTYTNPSRRTEKTFECVESASLRTRNHEHRSMETRGSPRYETRSHTLLEFIISSVIGHHIRSPDRSLMGYRPPLGFTKRIISFTSECTASFSPLSSAVS